MEHHPLATLVGLMGDAIGLDILVICAHTTPYGCPIKTNRQ